MSCTATLAERMPFPSVTDLLTRAFLSAPRTIVDKTKVQSRTHPAERDNHTAVVRLARSCQIFLTTQATEC